MSHEREAEKYERLLVRLRESTTSGRVRWEPALRDDAFISVLNSGIVEITSNCDYDQHDLPVRWFQLILFDANERVVDRLSSQTGFSGADSIPASETILGELYRLARAQAMDADEVVDDILQELEAAS